MSRHSQTIDELRARVARYPADRYPVQHATAQFHLGVAYVDEGLVAEAEAALAAAAELFRPEQLPAEHATALNALGAALRLAERPAEAAQAFRHAAAAYEQAGRNLERGAALFNLGLVEREAGRDDEALDAFRRARQLLDRRGAAAALRELGATLLTRGEADEAVAALEEALLLAERAADSPDVGATANVLGLSLLAAGRPAEAADAFSRAAAAHPRPLRPQEYAMAKANLALAYERLGEPRRARLAARQALGAPAPPEPVATQAAAVVERLGDGRGDLVAVLGGQPRDRWPGIVREELARWADAPPSERRAEAAAWIDGQLAQPDGGDLAEAWLGGLLEVPPESMDALVRAALEAAAEREAEEQARWRDEVRRAAARFHIPQMQRLEETFARVAGELGDAEPWT